MAQVILTDHATFRLLERGVDVHEAKKVAKTGAIIKTDFNGIMTKSGISSNSKSITVVCKKEGNKIVIITAYYAN